MNKVIIIGGIGSGTVIAQAIRDSNIKGDNSITLEGFMSHEKRPGDYIEDLPVVASQTADNILSLKEKGVKFIFALHRSDQGEQFVKLFDELGLGDDTLATFIHPSAYIAPDVIIGSGSVIMPYVMISSHVEIGKSTLIMTGATIGHNTKLGIFNHVASQAVIGAFIKTGVGVHFGLNSTIREYIFIEDYSTIGMGAVLTSNVGKKEIWVGNPARFLRKAK